MAIAFGDIGGVISGYAKNGMIWLIGIIIIFAVVFFFYLYTSRRSKLKYNCIELISFGNGKIGMNTLKAGVFKSKTSFFGLIDYGPEYVIKTSDGRTIQQGKTSHLHDIFGKKGFVCLRKSDDPKILVPISRIQFENLGALLEIAPADYRDASVKIYKEAVEETKGTWEKILPYIAVGLIVILCIITIVINMQMTNNTVNKVGNMLIKGCQGATNAGAGTSP